MNNTQLSIIDYTPELAEHFNTINRQWIADMFVLEAIDKQVLEDPQTYIIDNGGYIWFAQHPSHGVVGTCALLNQGEGVYELTKMGVVPGLRGLKIGETLLQYVLGFCEQNQHKCTFLLTNKKCEAAIHLYEKLGFSHSRYIMDKFGGSYDRCDVAMVYDGT